MTSTSTRAGVPAVGALLTVSASGGPSGSPGSADRTIGAGPAALLAARDTTPRRIPGAPVTRFTTTSTATAPAAPDAAAGAVLDPTTPTPRQLASRAAYDALRRTLALPPRMAPRG
jgi:hypothetical protein